MDLDSIEELNRLEKQIQETQKFLEKNSHEIKLITKLKQQRLIISIVAILLLAFGIWSYFFKQQKVVNSIDTASVLKSNLILIHKDSVKFYKNFYQNRQRLKPEVSLDSNLNNNNNNNNNNSFDNQEVVYFVQFAALEGVDTKVIERMKIKHQYSDGYVKLLIGNFSSYEDALDLRYQLIKFGFKGSFIKAQSYGKSIKLKKALKLSNEEILINK